MGAKSLSKSHAQFWAEKLFKRATGKDDSIADWHVQMSHGGVQRKFSLGTPNKAEAAKTAKEAYFLLKGQGWDAVWAKFGSKRRKAQEDNPGKCTSCQGIQDLTFAEYIKILEEKCLAGQETILRYKDGLRVLLASMFGLDVGNKKYDHYNKFNDAYEKTVFSIKISEVSSTKIEEWQCGELKKRTKLGKDKDSSATTINSITRGCSGLFSKKILKGLGVLENFTSPFAGVTKLPEGSKCYYSDIDAKELLRKAEKDLRESSPDEFIIIVLALLQGLRANEIDKMIWRQINFSDGTLSVLQTKYFTPKTRSSCKTIPLNDYAAAALRRHRELRNSGDEDFVVAPDVKFQKREIARTKRCVQQMAKVIAWLRDFGIRDQKPIHTLRKECGSLIYRQTGDINATRLFLRDSTMAGVISSYADSTVVKVPKLDLGPEAA